MRFRIKGTAAMAALLATLLPTPGAATTLGPPFTVADLVRRSADIVVGTVAEVKDGRVGSLPTIEVRVEVSDTIRGRAGRTLTFRQLAARATSGAPQNGRRYLGLVPGMPAYAKGDHVLLFLAPEGVLGLRTTVGLQQGRFTLTMGEAENGSGNQGLFRGLDLKPRDASEAALVATPSGRVQAGALLALLHRAVDGKWWDGGAR